jgi:hypothetical protein
VQKKIHLVPVRWVEDRLKHAMVWEVEEGWVAGYVLLFFWVGFLCEVPSVTVQ